MDNEDLKFLKNFFNAAVNPNYDDSCKGCGYCCIKYQCREGFNYYKGIMIENNNISECNVSNGTDIIRVTRHCPGLYWDKNLKMHRCKLVTDKLVENIEEILGIGLGCPSNLNSWRLTVKKRL